METIAMIGGFMGLGLQIMILHSKTMERIAKLETKFEILERTNQNGKAKQTA